MKEVVLIPQERINILKAKETRGINIISVKKHSESNWTWVFT
jgi:hypothetical protein